MLFISPSILFYHNRTKHIQLDYHFVTEKVVSGDIHTRCLPSACQAADLFTKPLNHLQFVYFRDKLGVHKLQLANLRGDDKLETSYLKAMSSLSSKSVKYKD